MKPEPALRGAGWKWSVCGLLLCASAVNYLDRQTLANAAVRITREFGLTQEQYGNLELAFGWAFAAGSLVFGILADRIPVRWLYPAVLALWSITGLLTGSVENYEQLLFCRGCLGLFEAGHWPCALKTTQQLLLPRDRTMGNSVLQSGTSIGAILTPLLMNFFLTDAPGSWRGAFQWTGGGGLIWIVFWFALVGRADLQPVAASPASNTPEPGSRLSSIFLSRRFLVLIAIIILINTSWQLLRAWLPKFLQEARGYSESATLYFTACYYVATDIGCLGAGALTLWFHRRGRSVHRARSLVFLICTVLTALTVVASVLPKSVLLLGTLLLIGMGALGLFPCYYALSQELTSGHQGKVTGLTGVFAWLCSAPTHKFFGRVIDRTGSYDLGIALIGCAPIIACLVLFCFWKDPAGGAPNPAGAEKPGKS